MMMLLASLFVASAFHYASLVVSVVTYVVVRCQLGNAAA